MKSSEKSFLICILVALLASYQCQALPSNQTLSKGNENNVADASVATTDIPTPKEETITTLISSKTTTTTTTPISPQVKTAPTVAPEITTPTPAENTTITDAPETTTTPAPETTTTTTHAPDTSTTTIAPNTTTIAPTTTTIAPNTTTTTVAPSTTTTQAPVPPACHHFDGPSFIGGIVLTIGLLAIGLVAYKFYKARNERNYHTL